jgi:hypothetical protein
VLGGGGVPRVDRQCLLAYYWLRTSTINANVPAPFFQTLERHWETVVERVAAFVDTLVHRTRP